MLTFVERTDFDFLFVIAYYLGLRLRICLLEVEVDSCSVLVFSRGFIWWSRAIFFGRLYVKKFAINFKCDYGRKMVEI